LKDLCIHSGGGQKLSDLDLSICMMHSLGISGNTSNTGFMILDSETTETLLPKEVKPKLDKLFNQFTGMEIPTLPVKLTPRRNEKMANIVFQPAELC